MRLDGQGELKEARLAGLFTGRVLIQSGIKYVHFNGLCLCERFQMFKSEYQARVPQEYFESYLHGCHVSLLVVASATSDAGVISCHF